MNENNNQVFSYRRAFEALRNGVPNRDAVKVLGSNQPEAENKFLELLGQVKDIDNPPPTSLGMLISGGFGSGKSHLLEYLEYQALKSGFVCSRIAISKETPLNNLEKVFKSAIDNGRLPGDHPGQLIDELGHNLNHNSEKYADFFKWANSESSGLNQIFPASLMVHERSQDLDIVNDIRWFWSGERIKVSRVKTGLRQIGQSQNYSFKPPKVAEAAEQRMRFVLELIKGAGYNGWVVLLDEVEVVASFSILQRAKSYAELARWMGKRFDDQYPGLVVAATVADDFQAAVLELKGDRDTVGPRLRSRGEDAMAGWSEAGINFLEGRETIDIQSPTGDEMQQTLEKLREIYSIAYDWDAPRLEGAAGGATYLGSIRIKVRTAINEWDLLRIYPDVHPETESEEFTFAYEEDPEFEHQSVDESLEPGDGGSQEA